MSFNIGQRVKVTSGFTDFTIKEAVVIDLIWPDAELRADGHTTPLYQIDPGDETHGDWVLESELEESELEL